MATKVYFSSQTCIWSTPDNLYLDLCKEFKFTLDVCALPENTKCKFFFTPDDDGLLQPWGKNICWCNPPYGRKIGQWCEKAFRESFNGATTVMILPARTGTNWFHNWVLGKAEIRFLKGRLKFGNAKYNAPFDSMIIIYKPNCLT